MKLENLLKESSAQKQRAAGRADGPGVRLPPLEGPQPPCARVRSGLSGKGFERAH